MPRLLLLATLLAAASPHPAAAEDRLAVLEITGPPPISAGALRALSDAIRGASARALKGRWTVITRESMNVVLQESGGKLSGQEGESEVETARNLGAQLVVSGEVVPVGRLLVLSLKLHETAHGRLLSADRAKASSQEALLDCAAPLALALLESGVGSPTPRQGRGEAVRTPPPELLELERQLAPRCSGGRSCWELGDDYRLGRNGRWVDDASAAALYLRSCRFEHPDGCSALGYMYEQGRGVPRDVAVAATLYERACRGGNGRACASLGAMYRVGLDVPRDDARAAALLRQACERGDGDGCAGLGDVVLEGRGVAQDLTRAVAAYRRGCEAGSARACTNLGVLHAEGRGVPRDDARAAQLFRVGCERGSGEGCADLAVVYRYGRGVPRDEARAAEYYRRGCERGSDAACRGLAQR
jgi:TPR repeat protein